ncbi:MAG TPA: acyltransferase [Pseudolysinimonas sp.]|nr:acyltransferase [Pseudolysinimonas sp.]
MTAPPAAEAAPATRRPRLYEIDVVRILTFACVIAVHVTSHTASSDDYGLNGLLALVHFTRQVFFALTTFVLLYGQLARPVSMKAFWPKRFLLVGVPYVMWSTIYYVAANLYHPHGTAASLIGNYFYHLVTGTAWYHLYFLLVTMQVYLLVPVIIWFVKKTRGHHRAVLIASFVLQLAIMAFYKYGPDAAIGPYEKLVFASYEFFIIAGAIAADHAAPFLAWVRAHRGAIGWIVLAGAVFMLSVYLGQHWFLGQSLYSAGTPLQPATMIWAVCVGLGFLAVGTWWADRRNPDGRFAHAVDRISDRSFGIFLSHPLVLWVLLWIGFDWVPDNVPKPWLTLVAYVVVVIVAYAIADVARRTPLSLPLAGRRFSRRKSD